MAFPQQNLFPVHHPKRYSVIRLLPSVALSCNAVRASLFLWLMYSFVRPPSTIALILAKEDLIVAKCSGVWKVLIPKKYKMNDIVGHSELFQIDVDGSHVDWGEFSGFCIEVGMAASNFWKYQTPSKRLSTTNCV